MVTGLEQQLQQQKAATSNQLAQTESLFRQLEAAKAPMAQQAATQQSGLAAFGASRQAREEAKKSALGTIDRLRYGFADKKGQEKIVYESLLKQNFTPQEIQENRMIVKMDNGELGVRTDSGIRPVDPKGFSFTDAVGDIAESAGKGFTAGGGVLGTVVGGGATLGAGGVAGAAAGTALGELARQEIGRAIGVRDDIDLGEIAFEAAMGGAGEFGGHLLGKGLSRIAGKIGQKFAPAVTKQGDDLASVLIKSSSGKSALKNMTTAQKAELKNMSKQQIVDFLTQNTDDISKFSARQEDLIGVDDDVIAFVANSAREGDALTPIAGKNIDEMRAASDVNLSKFVDKYKAQSKALRRFASKRYGEEVAKIGDRAVDIGDVRVSVKDILDEFPDDKSLRNIVNKLKLNNDVIDVKELLKAKRTLNDTNTLRAHWRNVNAGKEIQITEKGSALQRLDSLLRSKINEIDEIAPINEMFGEILDTTHRFDGASEFMLERQMGRLKDPKGAWKRIGDPVNEMEALALKYGDEAKVTPLKGDLMKEIAWMKFGTRRGSTPPPGILDVIPNGSRIRTYVSMPTLQLKRINTQFGFGNQVKQGVQELIEKGSKSRLGRMAKSKAGVAALKQFGLVPAGKQSLNALLYGQQ